MRRIAKPLPALLLETIVSPGNFMERVEQLFCRPPQQPAGNNAAKTLLTPSQPAGRADALPYGHTLEAELHTFVFSSPESRATFLFPTQKRCTWGKEKQAGGFPLSEAPGCALNLLQPFGKGRSSPSWQSVGTDSQTAREGGKESQLRLLSPHTPSPSPAAALGSATRPPNPRVWGWGWVFFERTSKAAAAHISLRLR